MAASQGGLDTLTIVAIFAVVFAGIYGVASQVDRSDATKSAEQRLRAAVWAELNDRRATAGERAVSGSPSVRDSAQEAAEALLAGRPGRGAFGDSGDTLADGRCAELSVSVERAGGGSKPTETAEAVVDALAATDGARLLSRSGNYRHGLGVAVTEATVVVVYRSCTPLKF